MIATLGILLLGQLGGPADPRRSYAGGDKDAILMLPPETVCDSDVREMVWTADGGSLVVRREVTAATPADYSAASSGKAPSEADSARLRPRFEILVWSARSHRSRVVLSGDAQNQRVSEMDPLPGTDRIVFIMDERIAGADGQVKSLSSYSMLSADTGEVTRLSTYDPAQLSVGIGLSPKRPLGFLNTFEGPNKTHSVRFFGPDGRLGNPIALPTRSNPEFDEGGAPTLFVGVERKDKKAIFHYQRIDLASAKLGATYDESSLSDPTPPPPVLQTVPVSGTADGARAPSLLLKVSGGKPAEAGVVSTDGIDAQLSPKNDAVAYVSQGSAMIRPLAKVSRQAYDAAIMAAQKAIAMSNAKQVALGLIMFASDMDDVFPSQGDYNKVWPYLKDRSLMDSFSYTFGGGSLATIDKPAETSIGYASGPGGRAVAYADGHVKWVPDGQ